MRAENLVVAALGVAAVAVAAALSWRWRRLTLLATRPDGMDRRATFADAVATLGAVVAAGSLAGLLVLGVVGRAVMRLLAATSGATAQGRLTEAGERVGEITLDGTLGFLVFVGLGGGVVTALAYLLVRHWLPAMAGPAGLVAGLILIGTLGVADPLAPDNVDFAILRPTWLAIVVLVGTGLLFATTFTALAARLDQLAASGRRRRWASCAALVLLLPVPPVLAVAVVYVGGRVAVNGAVGALLARPQPAWAGRALVGLAALATLAVAAAATVRIATG